MDQPLIVEKGKFDEEFGIQDVPKRNPSSLEREYLFHPEELATLLKLDGDQVSKIRYEPVSNLWHITTKEDV